MIYTRPNNRILYPLHRIIMIAVAFVAVLITQSCTETVDVGSFETEKVELSRLINEGSLLLDVKKNDDAYLFLFESDTILVSTSLILSVEEQHWNTQVIFLDHTPIDIPTVGTSIEIKPENLKINPSGCAPLSAELNFSAPVQGRVHIRIASKPNHKSNEITHLTEKYGFNHVIPIHGLYADYLNTIYITLTDKEGAHRITDSIQIKVAPLKNIELPVVDIIQADVKQMEPGLTLINYMGANEFDTHRPFMIDADGEIRWLLLFDAQPAVANVTAHVGLQRLADGNFILGDVKTSRILIIDMFGNLIKSYDLAAKGYEFHHEVTETTINTILVCVTKKTTTTPTGVPVIYDHVIEIDRESGAIVTEWDLKQSLDEKRLVMTPAYPPTDRLNNWAHNNAVTYSPSDDHIIVSLRQQGLVKLSKSNQVKWILAAHTGWGKNRRGENLSAYLLNPLNNSSEKITDMEVINGTKVHAEFEWIWGAHCPIILPDGSVFVFDNGAERLLGNEKALYSRAVGYQIDEKNKTAQQTWQYGKERGAACYSEAVSSVQFLPITNHILFAPGFFVPTIKGKGSKVVEVTKASRAVVAEIDLTAPNGMVFHRATRMPLYPVKGQNLYQ